MGGKASSINSNETTRHTCPSLSFGVGFFSCGAAGEGAGHDLCC